MPRGIYDRAALKAQSEPQLTPGQDAALVAQKDVQSPKAPTLANRTVWRIILHNGVSTQAPPRLNAEKGIFHKASPYAKPHGRPLADEMYLTPIGVYARIGDYEKLITFANIYECDLAPEA